MKIGWGGGRKMEIIKQLQQGRGRGVLYHVGKKHEFEFEKNGKGSYNLKQDIDVGTHASPLECKRASVAHRKLEVHPGTLLEIRA